MGTYVPDHIGLPVGLDEVGLRLGLQRLPQEPLYEYRQRLLLEARDPADPTEDYYIRGIGRKVGRMDLPVFEVDLILDVNENPLATDPKLEITSTHFRAYYDYDNLLLDVEVFFGDQSNGRWLTDVLAALTASAYFSVTTLDDYSAYLSSYNLRYGSTADLKMQFLLLKSYQNRLQHRHVKEIFFSDATTFTNEVASNSLVVADGDFYVDYTEGEVISYNTPGGTCSYSYANFPYRVWWQPVRSVPFSDPDLDYRHKKTLISDSTGLAEYVNLRSRGARIINLVLQTHPLGWGE